MRRRTLPAIVVGVVVLVAAALWWGLGDAPAPPSATVPPSPSGTEAAASASTPTPTPAQRILLGEVTDRVGQPIGLAVVAVENDGGAERARAVTDIEGRFSIDPFPADAAAIAFRAEGFVSARVDATSLPPLREAFWSQPLDADPSRRVIHVRAGDVDVEGARVFRVTPLPARQADGVSLSGASGRAFVGADVEGPLMAAHPAFGAAYIEKDTASLPPGGLLVLRLVDDERQPVEGARVLVRATPPPGGDPLAVALRVVQQHLAEQQSDADGVVRWPAPDGAVVIEVGAPGFRPHRSEERVRGGREQAITIRLSRSPVVVGVVVDAVTGAPVAGAIVRGDAGGRVGAEATTDDEGRFELAGFDARPSSLSVRRRGYSTLTVGSIDGAASRLEPLRLQLSPGRGDQVVGVGITIGLVEGRVTVRAVEAGSPAEAAQLAVGDVIMSVDGVSLGEDLADATGRIRGQPGTSVRLGLVGGDGRRRDVDVERQLITVQPRRRR